MEPETMYSTVDEAAATAAIVVCDPGTVERSVGKAKRVIDTRV